jgi:hypothetical protein
MGITQGPYMRQFQADSLETGCKQGVTSQNYADKKVRDVEEKLNTYGNNGLMEKLKFSINRIEVEKEKFETFLDRKSNKANYTQVSFPLASKVCKQNSYSHFASLFIRSGGAFSKGDEKLIKKIKDLYVGR